MSRIIAKLIVGLLVALSIAGIPGIISTTQAQAQNQTLVHRRSTAAPAAAVFNNMMYLVYSDLGHRLQIVTSKDGIHWTNPAAVGQMAAPVALTMAVLGNNLFLAYIANDGTYDLEVVSTTDGHTWSPTNPSLAQQQSRDAPTLAVFNNALYLAYRANNGSNDLLLTSSTDGVTWAHSIPIVQKSLVAPALTTFNNALHLAYVGLSDDIHVVASTDGASWKDVPAPSQVQLTALPPALTVINNALNLIFVTNDGSNALLSIQSPDGMTWAATDTALKLASPFVPAVVSFVNDNKSVVYEIFIANDGSGDLYSATLEQANPAGVNASTAVHYGVTVTPSRTPPPTLVPSPTRTPLPTASASPTPGGTVVFSNNDSGPGSLRDTLATVPAGSTITFASNVSQIVLKSGLTISQNVTISGPGADKVAVIGTGFFADIKFSVITVQPGSVVTISGLIIFNGNSQSTSQGINNGGAIDNSGTLTVSHAAFASNKAVKGGALYNTGSLTVSSCVFYGNQDLGAGAAIDSMGGILTVTGSTFVSNHSGAIQAEKSSVVTISSSAFLGNDGALFSDHSTVTVSNSSFLGNHSGAGGGAIFAFGGTTVVTNSTLYGNTGTTGGGIFAIANSPLQQPGTVKVLLGSDLIAGNQGRSPDVAGNVTSLGYNLIGLDNDGLGQFLPSDQLGTAAAPLDPKLIAIDLTAITGSTSYPLDPKLALSVALQSGSPAIGKGNCALPPPAISVTVDQSGITRKKPCDVGAYETP